MGCGSSKLVTHPSDEPTPEKTVDTGSEPQKAESPPSQNTAPVAPAPAAPAEPVAEAPIETLKRPSEIDVNATPSKYAVLTSPGLKSAAVASNSIAIRCYVVQDASFVPVQPSSPPAVSPRAHAVPPLVKPPVPVSKPAEAPKPAERARKFEDLTPYQKLQQSAYACTYQQEVITAQQKIDDLTGLASKASELAAQQTKLAQFKEKRDKTGAAHTVLHMTYEQISAHLIKIQKDMAAMERAKNSG